MKTSLQYFTDPIILSQIDGRRLAKLLGPFTPDLQAAGIALPPDPESSDYLSIIGAIFADTARLPKELFDALLTIESAASPENRDRLDEIIQRRIPNVSLSQSCPLDRALELWFQAPEELAPFHCGSRREPCPEGLVSGEALIKTQPPEPPLAQINGEQNGAPAAPSSIENDDETNFRRLASLTPAQYDRVRKEAARSLRVRVETLDAEVANHRTQRELDDALNSALSTLNSPLPWPNPLDGQLGPSIADVLSRVSARFSLYVVLPPGAPDALALWTAHTHCFSAFLQSPRLNLSSPKEGCGKTTVLDVLASMTPRPLRTENLTAPVLFRIVDQRQPTLLLDEVDTYLHQANELRGLLNAGHKRGGCAYRCEGDGNAVRAFKAFAPAALAGIGSLPATLHDRSIYIPLVEAEPDQIPARFDGQCLETESDLCRQLARWAADNILALRTCDPPLPATAFNRLADNWRPLFAIAHLASADWPQRATSSFHQLSNKGTRLASTKLVNGAPAHSALCTQNSSLLLAIRDVFTQTGLTRIPSKTLAHSLRTTLNGSSPTSYLLTAASLARRLTEFGIHSRVIRLADRTARCYELADFTPAFTRFLSNDSQPASPGESESVTNCNT